MQRFARRFFRTGKISRKTLHRRRAWLSQAVGLENLEGRVLLSTVTVTNTLDSGSGSLRWAIQQVNANTGVDTIDFAIASSGVQTIDLDSALPTITQAVTIDGTTEGGYAGAPLIDIEGAGAGAGANGLDLAAQVTVKGVAIGGFGGDGILVDSGGAGSVIENDYIGTDATSANADSNNEGIVIDDANVSVTGNVISGNTTDGILVEANGATITSNMIGTDATGTVAVANSNGITVSGASGVTIGGAAAGAGNVISGNFENAVEFDNSSNSTVTGNLIGVDFTGGVAMGNGGDGVTLSQSSGITVSGDVISNNVGNGITIYDSTGNFVQGNLIGTDSTGTVEMGNFGSGVYLGLDSSGNTVGGNSTADRNIISNNFGDGVTINTFDPETNTVQGNYIGTDITGEVAMGNLANGITVSSAGATITGNVISANDGDGIVLQAPASVMGNFIGTGADGTTNLGNAADGIYISSNGSTIGDSGAGDANIIAFNQGDGVDVASGVDNSIRDNSIYANSLLGIDLGGSGTVVPNDSQGHVGPNDYQNFPAITTITNNGSTITISGTLDAAASSNFALDFFSNPAANPSSYGQGQTFLGSASIATDGSGHATFTVTLTAPPAGESFVSATATDSAGNSSEFAADATVPAHASAIASTTTLLSSLNPSTFGASVTFTATVTTGATGSVTFMDGATVLGTVSLTGNTAALTTSALSVATHSITAVYSGDANYTGSTSAPVSQEVDKASTTTTLGSSLNPSTFGASVTFTATVSNGTGSVTFMDGATVLGTVSLTGNSAAFTTSALSVATHSITAVYSGDGNYTGSTSAPVSQEVDKVSTSTTLGSSLNPSTFGASVTFTATVSNGTGSVTFMDGSTVLGTVSLTGNTAALTTSALSVATHSITAVYSGDGNYTGSTSAPVSQEVDKASTSTTLGSSLNPSTFGASVTFTATVSNGTGSVTFMDGSTVLGTVSLTGNSAAFTTSALSVATHSITAVYSGDGSYTGSTSSPLSQEVDKASTSTTLGSSLNPSTFGTSVTFTATVSNGTGSVTFMDGSTVLGTVSLTGNSAAFTTSALSVATHSITAVYGGDSNYTGSTSAPVSEVVNKASTSTTLGSSLNPSTFGTSVTFTATVSNGTGSVTFMDGSTVLGTVSLTGNSAAFTTSALSVATHSITAVYGGDSNYTGSTSAPVSEVVNKASTSTTLGSSLNPSTFGTSVTFTATVSNGTGSVTFMDGSTVLGTVSLTGNSAAFTTSALSVATHSITAVYGGDSNYTGSTSAPVSEVVNKASTSTTLGSSLNPSTFGASVTFTATVSNGTGSVTFMDGSTVLGTIALSGHTAAFTTSALSVATHSITAVYGGDTSYTGSTSAPLSQVVNLANSATTLSSSLNPSQYGQSVTLIATLTSGATGSVTFKDGATVLGTGTISGNTATFTTSSLSIATHSITAVYGGDSHYATSTSTALSQVVQLDSTTTTLSSSLNPSISGQAVTFTATLTGIGSPTGTVTFKDGSTVLGTGTISSGKATFTTSTLSVATHSITAVYAGNSTNATSTSAVLSQVVNSATSSISGKVFKDLTGNGMSSDDTALGGVTVEIFLDKNNSGTLDSADGGPVTTVLSNSTTGAYSFSGLANGRYFVEQLVPTGYVQTQPVYEQYYTVNVANGASITNDNFDNFQVCNCSGDLTNVYFIINGCTKVTDLRGNTHQGDTVQAVFTVLAGHTDTFSLASYYAPDNYFNASDAYEQAIYQVATGTFGAGQHTLTVKLPSCDYQVDFMCGTAITQLGPAGSNIFYSAESRLISADNGGTVAPPNSVLQSANPLWQ